jgi:predicted ATPase
VHAEACLAIAREHGLLMYQAMATVMRGWALIHQGRHEVAIEQMRQGLEALEATGTELLRPHFSGLLAEALAKAGQTEPALRTLEGALAVAQGTGEGAYEAELYRLKGEVLLIPAAGSANAATSGRADAAVQAQAEACFDHALRIAREQKAKSWELRASMSIARHIRHSKHKARTCRLRQFAGFATTVARAKVLIDECAAARPNRSRLIKLRRPQGSPRSKAGTSRLCWWIDCGRLFSLLTWSDTVPATIGANTS